MNQVKITVYCLTALEASGLKSRCWRGHEDTLLPLSAPGDPRHSLAYGNISPVSASILELLSNLGASVSVSLPSPPIWTPDIVD